MNPSVSPSTMAQELFECHYTHKQGDAGADKIKEKLEKIIQEYLDMVKGGVTQKDIQEMKDNFTKDPGGEQFKDLSEHDIILLCKVEKDSIFTEDILDLLHYSDEGKDCDFFADMEPTSVNNMIMRISDSAWYPSGDPWV